MGSFRVPQKVFETVPAGQYGAVVTEVTQEEGQWGPYAKFTFQLQEPGHEAVTITGAASARFSPRSKLYLWTRALLGGRAIPLTYTWDADDCINRRCVLAVGVERDENGAEFNRVTAIFPVRETAQARPQALPVEEEVPF